MMMAVFIGAFAFLLMYLYEVNQILWNRQFFKSLFTVAFLILMGSTLLVIQQNLSIVEDTVSLFTLGSLVTITSAVLMLYTLFFAIPFNESYVEQFNNRKVYTEKMYAICRHPGVLWFASMYFGIYLIFPSVEVLIYGVVLSTLNLIYIIIQDKWSFPLLFTDYNLYKKNTPFLIPTFKSIKRSIDSYKGRI